MIATIAGITKNDRNDRNSRTAMIAVIVKSKAISQSRSSQYNQQRQSLTKGLRLTLKLWQQPES